MTGLIGTNPQVILVAKTIPQNISYNIGLKNSADILVTNICMICMHACTYKVLTIHLEYKSLYHYSAAIMRLSKIVMT